MDPIDGGDTQIDFVWVTDSVRDGLNDPKKVSQKETTFNRVVLRFKQRESFANERFLVAAMLEGVHLKDRSLNKFTMTGHFLLRHAHAALKLPTTTSFSKVLIRNDVEEALANLDEEWFEDFIQNQDATLTDLCSKACSPESGRESIQ